MKQVKKVKRSLSGIYFRSKDEETGKWGNICFEDLTEEEQTKYMNGRSIEWLQGLATTLANTLNEIGSVFDITKE